MPDPNLTSFIWSVADLLRGDYTQSDYGKVILPFTVLRRMDCVLEPTKAVVLAEKALREKAGLNPEPFILKKAKQLFYNTSPLDLPKLMGDQGNIAENLRAYIQGFSPAVRDIFEHFDFDTQIDRLSRADLLYLVTEKFANIDLHPDVVSNAQMGLVFEELIRKFAEASNATAGEHFTPREVIRLMVNLLFIEDEAVLTQPGVVRSMYDPTAGTGGMLSVGEEHVASLNPNARLVMYGQELNPESHAICNADMLIKGQDIANIILGNTLSNDGLLGRCFDSMLSNPPFGVEWKKNEAIIGLPTDMFYNTGISTYIWVVSNRKPAPRKGKVQLIDASASWQKMRKSLGSKRKELGPEHIEDITQIFGKFRKVTRDGVPISRIFKNEEFGYRTMTVERPERDAAGKVVLATKGKGKGKPVPESSLRDTENVPLSDDVSVYFEREVKPHAPDAWIDHDKTTVGCEIPFNRHFYMFKAPRPLAGDRRRTQGRHRPDREDDRGAFMRKKSETANSSPGMQLRLPISEIALWRESVDLEIKLAAGRDGQGAVPVDFWRTYSAFANTEPSWAAGSWTANPGKAVSP